jgi:hypothetical protein
MKLNIKIYTKKIIDNKIVQTRYWWAKEVDGSIFPDYCWQECDECPPVVVGEIVAGQHTEVGHLVVWEDEDNLYAKYALEDGWLLKESHLFVGCADNIPGKIKKGGLIPTPGHFPYQEIHDGVSTFTYIYPRSEIEKCTEESCIDIAAHAVVFKMEGEEVMEETAWSTGEEFGDPRWGWYSNYCPCE